MKILWITSFRNFKKVSRDTDIQLKFLKEIAKISNVDLCITQFNEKNVKSKVIDYPKSYPKDEPKRRCPNINKAIKDLKFKPKISLKNGLKNYLLWAKDNYKY